MSLWALGSQHFQQLEFERTVCKRDMGEALSLHYSHWLEFCFLRPTALVLLPKEITFPILEDSLLSLALCCTLPQITVLTNACMIWFKGSQSKFQIEVLAFAWVCVWPGGEEKWVQRGAGTPFSSSAKQGVQCFLPCEVWEEDMNDVHGGLRTVPSTRPSLWTCRLLP